jgi:hypothetical protein
MNGKLLSMLVLVAAVAFQSNAQLLGLGNILGGATGTASGVVGTATGVVGTATGVLGSLTGGILGGSGIGGILQTVLNVVIGLLDGLLGGLLSGLLSALPLNSVLSVVTGLLGGLPLGVLTSGGLTSILGNVLGVATSAINLNNLVGCGANTTSCGLVELNLQCQAINCNTTAICVNLCTGILQDLGVALGGCVCQDGFYRGLDGTCISLDTCNVLTASG